MGERSKTVDDALRLLESLARDGASSASQLAERTGVNRTSAYRLLHTLLDHRLVRRPRSGRWQLGIALRELGAMVEDDLCRVARPRLEELADLFDETVVLSVPDGDDVVALDQAVAGRGPLRIDYQAGIRHPQTLTAHGRAHLAFTDRDHIDRVLDRDPDANRIRALVGEIRAAGYATSHDELQDGACGIAVPVLVDAEPVATVGVVAPVGRLPAEADAVAALRRAAARIADDLTDETTSTSPDPGQRERSAR